MATSRRFGKKLPVWARRDDMPGVRIDSGPFIGFVKNNKDPVRAGRLQVWIPDLGGIETNQSSWRTVSYASPFAGTNRPAVASQNNNFNAVNHSYGMWAVPPDLECQVICTFIAGDPDRGFWFACVNSDLSHYMTPGLAGGPVDSSAASTNLKSTYDRTDSNWPVVEFNEEIESNTSAGFINNIKPAHETQTKVLINQGLDRDKIRGAISSSSQRESPSTVFGMSTPGRPLNDPKDDPLYAARAKSGSLTPDDAIVKGRKGGHTFVMDDGEMTGGNQLIRLRTAGGHQILMNDSEQVLYIANSNGSAWLEFTGGGHISMYSQAGFNVRTEGDFNLHSDKSINLNAKASININAGASIASQTASYSIKSTDYTVHSGTIGVLSNGDLSLQAAAGSFKTTGDLVYKGAMIYLNTMTPAAVPPVPKLTIFQHNDARWDPTKLQWINTPSVFESIATVTPSHEPWQRLATAGSTSLFDALSAPIKQSGLCVEQTAPFTRLTAVSAAGKTNEQLVEATLRAYGIVDAVQLAAIMAQCSHESGGFKYMRMNVSDAWYDRYEFRADLGNTQKGDGLKFRERGFIQITGRDIYTRASSYLGKDLIGTPNMAEDPSLAAQLVLYFFFEYKKSRTANVVWSDVQSVTRIVNGGVNGLAQREKLFAEYRQKYANGWTAGGPAVVVINDAGTPVVAANSTEAGPESGVGKAIQNPAPIQSLIDSAIAPAAIESTTANIAGLLAAQVKALLVQIGYSESYLNYSLSDTRLNRIGIYQIDRQLLKEYGYISDTVNSSTGTIYTGKDGIKSSAEWLKSAAVQEKAMEQIIADYYKVMVARQGIKVGDDVCAVAGMLATAYFFRGSERTSTTGLPPDEAKFWRQQGVQTNSLGINGVVAYNQGRYAIDVLSVQADTQTNPSAPVASDSVSGIDPESVINFSKSGSGDLSHYNQLGSAIRTAFEQMAQEYHDISKGKKLTLGSAYRSVAEQAAIYQAWKAAGGSKSNPKAGGYYMPAEPSPNAPHNRKIALDISRADIAELQHYNLLAKHNFEYTLGARDPVHIQFIV